jgi:hypothetical protein
LTALSIRLWVARRGELRDGDVSVVLGKLLKSLAEKLIRKKERLARTSRFQTNTIIEQFGRESDVVPKTITKSARQKDGTEFRSVAALS